MIGKMTHYLEAIHIASKQVGSPQMMFLGKLVQKITRIELFATKIPSKMEEFRDGN